MPQTVLDKLAHADREIAESDPGRRVETFQSSSHWIREHAPLVNYRADEGRKSATGLHG